ncbi:MAG TPA: 5-oxoprolinase subunit PxpB [Candidatus Acidoferrales bacterium]
MSAPRRDVEFRPASDQSLLVYFDAKISLHAHQQVRTLLHVLASQPIAGVHNLHPAYCSLLVDFDPLKMTHADLEAALRHCVEQLDELELPPPREIEIPACYGGEFGPDLEEIAQAHGLSPDQVIELHSSVTYTVYFLGFVPGFAYLGELPEALVTPRLASPRRTIVPGSVGVADNQTGVYPFATPGGWRLIGRTPIGMFRADRESMSLLNIGDHVRFVPISSAQFAATQEA